MGKHVQRISWGLLGEWWCVPLGTSRDEVIRSILMSTELPVDGDYDLVEDRLCGGFSCEDAACRHVHLNTGAYSYTSTTGNSPREPGDREEDWKTLIEQNEKGSPFIGGGLFCEDAPTKE